MAWAQPRVPTTPRGQSHRRARRHTPPRPDATSKTTAPRVARVASNNSHKTNLSRAPILASECQKWPYRRRHDSISNHCSNRIEPLRQPQWRMRRRILFWARLVFFIRARFVRCTLFFIVPIFLAIVVVLLLDRFWTAPKHQGIVVRACQRICRAIQSDMLSRCCAGRNPVNTSWTDPTFRALAPPTQPLNKCGILNGKSRKMQTFLQC
jgi:hypothetical protein